ncbi:hypothetical protein DCAR_0831861 [Daucus carota subsp. sativus]|uniref:RING-type E3 ubiquitin transferase n=1 Tax=Daucus carota subsp. sativus TaxID=79200 RepID=A0A175YP75_DAUCS|nr:hypothetical protein DCAR_0831861 [Daucus carota subsp. sativus]
MAFFVTIYHCIVNTELFTLAQWSNGQERNSAQDRGATVLGLENSKIELIPRHIFEKGKGILDAECAVCLSEFAEDEEIRTLPECLHSFHVECIDMWAVASFAS